IGTRSPRHNSIGIIHELLDLVPGRRIRLQGLERNLGLEEKLRREEVGRAVAYDVRAGDRKTSVETRALGLDRQHLSCCWCRSRKGGEEENNRQDDKGERDSSQGKPGTHEGSPPFTDSSFPQHIP